MTPIILLYTCFPLWGLAFLMWTQRFPKQGKPWLMWIAVFLCCLVPIFFFPLCAYADKIEAKREGVYTPVAMREFRLRMWICICSYIAELVIGFALKYMGFELYGELAVSCVNVFLFLLIITCWDLFRNVRQ